MIGTVHLFGSSMVDSHSLVVRLAVQQCYHTHLAFHPWGCGWQSRNQGSEEDTASEKCHQRSVETPAHVDGSWSESNLATLWCQTPLAEYHPCASHRDSGESGFVVGLSFVMNSSGRLVTTARPQLHGG